VSATSTPAEALFRAGINPKTPARAHRPRPYELLADRIRDNAQAWRIGAGARACAITSAATGRPGHFQNDFLVYGRADQPCLSCTAPVRSFVQGQRATYYCPAVSGEW